MLNTNGHSAKQTGIWTRFWHPFDDSPGTIEAFQQLIAQGIISFDELSSILSNDYFFNHEHLINKAYAIIDALNHEVSWSTIAKTRFGRR